MSFAIIVKEIITNCVLADENPKLTANRLANIFGEDDSTPPMVDFAYLDDLVTLDVGYLGARRTHNLCSQ